ncbi:MAG TPA: metallophosphoesterase, partial [Ferruginibacter sp.]|nr:metallophosphoesterase [Ferruginibacter sp.]HNA17037.1 metallophosphoesterase [Ferruginibacter sp.]
MQRRKFIQNLSLASAATVLPIGVNAENTGKKKRFRAAFISDIHIKTLDVAEAGMRKALQTINQSDKKPDFIINGGDSIMDALAVSKEKTKAQWDLFFDILQAENKLPVKHCMGNHDIWGWQLKEDVKSDPLYGKNWWLQLTGNTKSYYSFTHQNWHFIVLDSTQENNGGYIALLDAEQFNWLGAELESNKDKHICVVSHIPIVSFCSAMFFKDMLPNGDWKLSRALLHTDARMIKDLFRKYPNIRCCLSGHIHLQDEVTYLGIQYFCNGAVSGNWWKGAFQDFAPAYALFDFHQDGTVERTMVEY